MRVPPGPGMSSLFYGVAALRAGDRAASVPSLHQALEAFNSVALTGGAGLEFE
ncbi:MAG TPA: hypothetical protein VHJ78_08905 [Actinomycetota bacterium]|nr:hypothetical protein [Actinomycetota bacterium]